MVNQINPEIANKIREYTKESRPDFDNLRYELHDEGKQIDFIAEGDLPSMVSMLKNIREIEKILNAKFVSFTGINNTLTLTFEFQ